MNEARLVGLAEEIVYGPEEHTMVGGSGRRRMIDAIFKALCTAQAEAFDEIGARYLVHSDGRSRDVRQYCQEQAQALRAKAGAPEPVRPRPRV
jgi:hypothetical protein